MKAWVKQKASNFRDWSTTLGPLLLTVGLGAIVRGLSYLDGLIAPVIAEEGHSAEMLFDTDWWAVIWFTVGVVCALASINPRQPISSIAVGAIVFLHTLWAWSIAMSLQVDMDLRLMAQGAEHLVFTGLILWGAWFVPRAGGGSIQIDREELRSELRNC